jgi:hypothetical protein
MIRILVPLMVVGQLACSGPTMQTQTAGRLSKLGESCGRTADCEEALVCIASTCATGPMAPADGGVVEVVGPRLGNRGETCQVVSDCREGLTCRPFVAGTGGVCDLAKFPLTPSGKVCGGECNAPNDCCQLPVGYLGYASCEKLAKAITDTLGGATVAAACATSQSPLCFAHSVYCQCAANAWSCTENRCQYTGACRFSGVVPQGCADLTRSGTALVTTCDTANMRCQTPAAMARCTTPASCEGQAIADIATATCAPSECTCYQSNCYRRCTEELDCATGFTCDTASSVCVPAPQCTSNNSCARQLGNAAAECRNSVCVLPCRTDYDCTESGLGGRFRDSVCNAQNICESLGCTSDAECGVAGGVKSFCVAPRAPAAGRAARSAITTGRP